MIKPGNLRALMAFLLGSILFGCHQKTLSPGEYVRYLNSSGCGLNITRIESNIKFISKLQTPELITLLAKGSVYQTMQDFESEKTEYRNQLNVVFFIQDASPSDHAIKETVFDKDRYAGLMNYCNTELQNDFDLQLSNGETIPCSFVHVESANSAQPFIRINVVFTNVNPDPRDYTLVFDDNLFNTGKIKFHYGQEIFNQLPTLKI